MTLHGNLTWSNYAPEDIIADKRKKDRIILLTFPESVSTLGLEPSILTVAPEGGNVEFSYRNRDFNDDDVMYYMCSVYISGIEEFESWASRHDRNKIVVGGYHPTTFPKEFERLAHKIVRGPCDSFFDTIAQHGQVVNGIVRHNRLPRRDLYDIDFNQQIIPDKREGDRVVSINTSMGCNIKPACEFCASPIMCSMVLSKPLDLVRKEVEWLDDRYPEYCFVRDENFFMQKDWEDRLDTIGNMSAKGGADYCRLYLFASANTINEKKIEAMKRNRVYMVCLGLEDPTKEYGKNKRLDRACRMLHDAGIYVYLSYIVNPLDMIGADRSAEFYSILTKRFRELRPEMVCGNFLMPFPGTALWDKYYAYVDREDYKHYDSKTPFLVRNKLLQEKMKFFMFWNQWEYYNSDFYNTEVRKFACRDTLHLRFKELHEHFMEKYETIWNERV